MTRKRRNLSRVTQSARRGAAMVEFAVCLPILILLIFAVIEASSMIHLKQTLTIAAYEGVRTALLKDATVADAERTAQEMLDQRGVRRASIVIDPSPLSQARIGEYVRVSISAPCDDNSIIRGFFLDGRDVNGFAVMAKEFDD